jgi:hypothetical protein
MKKSDKGPIHLNPILGCLPFVVLGIFAIPCGLLTVFHVWHRDKKLLRQLQIHGRVLPWGEVEKHLNAGEGTLVVEQANVIGVHFWWTPDDVIATTPVPIPNMENIGTDFHRGKSSDPFVLWCFQNYLSVDNGKAFLTLPKGLDLSGIIENEYLLSLYPKANIVRTVLLSRTPLCAP